MNVAYTQKYGKTLQAVVKSKTSGDFQHALLALLLPPAEFYAYRMHCAMKGIGTKESTLTLLIAGQRARHLKGAAAAFESEYGRTLRYRVEDETSGEYRDLLFAALDRTCGYRSTPVDVPKV